MNIEQSYANFKKEAKEIQRYCNTASPNSCIKGKCKFSSTNGRCIFEEFGMKKPHEWDVIKRRKSE